MTAPDPEWVEAGARASALWHRGEAIWDSDDLALAELVIAAVEPLIRTDERRRAVERVRIPRDVRPQDEADVFIPLTDVIALIEEVSNG